MPRDSGRIHIVLTGFHRRSPRERPGARPADILHLRIRDQLIDRRSRRAAASVSSGTDPQISRLLAEADATIGRLDTGAYGRCGACHEPIERDRLIANPLVRFRLDRLTSAKSARSRRISSWRRRSRRSLFRLGISSSPDGKPLATATERDSSAGITAAS